MITTNSSFFNSAITPPFSRSQQGTITTTDWHPINRIGNGYYLEKDIARLVERYFCKKVLFVKENMDSISWNVHFTDGSMQRFSDLDIYTIENSLSKFDSGPNCKRNDVVYNPWVTDLGKYEHSLRRMGESIKKLYWYRKSKDPNFKLIE